RMLRRALRLREQLGPGHEAEVAESLHSLAYLCQEKGDLAAAEPLYQRCLKLREEKLGPDDPAVADTLDLMGQLYGWLGQDGRAAPGAGGPGLARQARRGPPPPRPGTLEPGGALLRHRRHRPGRVPPAPGPGHAQALPGPRPPQRGRQPRPAGAGARRRGALA